MTNSVSLETDLLDGVRAAQRAFFARIEPVRPEVPAPGVAALARAGST